MIRTTAYPRAALIGNPSDGYFGKTIAFVFSNFKAEVQLRDSHELRIIPCGRERLMFESVHDLVGEIHENGYYGGVRLVKSTIKVFTEYCTKEKINLEEKNFTISYSSDIPGQLGLAGSSAIVTAAMKALIEFYEVEIPKEVLANLILSAEKDELKIGAGLQDRVAQVYNSPVLMNFDEKLMKEQGYGEYTPFSKTLLPSLYIAYRTNLSEGSEITHNDFASRYKKKEPAVLDAIKHWSELTDLTWEKLRDGNYDIGAFLDRNFDIRRTVMNVSKGNIELVETARSVGASAKFTGSGGAIIGTYRDEKMFDQLVEAMKKIGAEVIKPEIV